MTQGGHRSNRAPGAPEDGYDRLLKILSKFMTTASAITVIERTERTSRIDLRGLRPGEAAMFFSALERAAASILDRRSQALLHGELEFELSIFMRSPAASTLTVNQSFDVRSEYEATTVRARARDIVTGLGGKSYDAVKAMTLVSELARNIVLYTAGGRVEFTLVERPRTLVVCATDEGPGIRNLDEILAGRYRSKTGLGKGLIGAKRLSDRFQIETGPAGTRIVAEVRF
jgi:serine/threonine-protein kinase RsbT